MTCPSPQSKLLGGRPVPVHRASSLVGEAVGMLLSHDWVSAHMKLLESKEETSQSTMLLMVEGTARAKQQEPGSRCQHPPPLHGRGAFAQPTILEATTSRPHGKCTERNAIPHCKSQSRPTEPPRVAQKGHGGSSRLSAKIYYHKRHLERTAKGL